MSLRCLNTHAPLQSFINSLPRYARFNSVRVQRAAQRYSEIAADCGLTPAQLAYAWVASRRYVGSTIVGATSAEQLVRSGSKLACLLCFDTLAAGVRLGRVAAPSSWCVVILHVACCILKCNSYCSLG